jgi:hypothetical protein
MLAWLTPNQAFKQFMEAIEQSPGVSIHRVSTGGVALRIEDHHSQLKGETWYENDHEAGACGDLRLGFDRLWWW